MTASQANDNAQTAAGAVSETTQRLIDMLRQRDAAGRAKYGTTLDRSDLTHAQWTQHLVEELLDGAGYALRMADTAQQPAAPDGLHGWKCTNCKTVFVHAQAERKDDTNGGATCPYCKAHGQYTYPYRLHNGDPCTGCGKPHDAVTVVCCPGGVDAPAPLPAAQSDGVTLLLRHGRHLESCPTRHDSAFKDRPVCDCGFDAAIASLRQQSGEIK